MTFYLQNFTILRPRFEKSQIELVNWLVRAHSMSSKESFTSLLSQIALGPGKIEKRGVHLGDFMKEKWEEMEIFPLDGKKEGEGLQKKMAFFQKSVEEIFATFYEKKSLPKNLIHVTCTGYVAPNGAQVLVSKKKAETTVTNAYHMGCYGSLPAIRMAIGFNGADIVHTEICSIHMNPSIHTVSEFVVESLFADGFIKYSVTKNKEDKAAFRFLNALEEIVENSLQDMSWVCTEPSFFMTLSKEIPSKIAKSLSSYLKKLLDKANLPFSTLSTALFAIHPGGLKIIEQIAEHLNLTSYQVAHSHEILKTCGNMSSATLPHVLEKILQDPSIPDKTIVICLAFGPGLTISGAILQKEL